MPPKQTDPQYKLRMTPDLKDRLDQASRESGRSLNSEILHRLETSFLPSSRAEDYALLSQRLASFKMLVRVTQRMFRDLAEGDDEMAKLSRDLDAILLAEDEREVERERQFPGTTMRSPFAKSVDEGRLAALAGKPEGDNPYEPDTSQYDGWAAGFLFAQDEIEQASFRAEINRGSGFFE